MLFLRIVIFYYIMWLNIIQDNILMYHDASLHDRVDFLVSQTDDASYFVGKNVVKKVTLRTT